MVTSHDQLHLPPGDFSSEYISEINVDSNNLTRSGYITPAVDFTNLQEVLVITKTKADLTAEDDAQEEGE